MEESENAMTSANAGLQRMFKHIPESKTEKNNHNLLNIAPIGPNHPHISLYVRVINPPATDVAMSLINNDHRKCVISVFVIICYIGRSLTTATIGGHLTNVHPLF